MKSEQKRYSVWVYGPRIGWKLVESGYDRFDAATDDLNERIEYCAKMKSDDVTGGAIVLGRQFPMPIAEPIPSYKSRICSDSDVLTEIAGRMAWNASYGPPMHAEATAKDAEQLAMIAERMSRRATPNEPNT